MRHHRSQTLPGIVGDCDGKSVFSQAFARAAFSGGKPPPAAGSVRRLRRITNLLHGFGVPPDFAADGPIRFTHRSDGDAELYFLANREAHVVETAANRVPANN